MNARLIKLFKKLNPAERRQLAEWTRCLLFNRRPEVTAMCEYMVTNADKPEAFQPELLHEAAFSGQPFQSTRLRHCISYLLQAAREYLAWREWAENEADTAPWLLKALRKRRLEFIFPYEEERALKALSAQPTRDAAFYFRRYSLLREKMEMATRSERSAKISLQPVPDALTIFFVADMLRLACAALTHQAIAGQTYRFAFLDALLDATEKEQLLSEPVVETYYHAYQILKNLGLEGEYNFKRLKFLLENQADIFSPEEIRGLYFLAINGCIRRMNAGQQPYIREAFELYRGALARGFLLEDGWISGFTYKNIIRIGAVLGEDQWTADFLDQYRQALHPRERDNLYKYNLAFWYLQKNDYSHAMPLLQQVEFDDALHHLEARRMLLRSYFQLGEWQALDSLLQSFSAYLRRQKGLGYHRKSNEKLLYFVKKLVEMDPSTFASREQLRHEIEETDHVAERKWLLEKLS